MTAHVVPPSAILMAIKRASAGGQRGSEETFDRQIAFAFSLNPTVEELDATAAELQSRDVDSYEMAHSPEFMDELNAETLLDSAERGDAAKASIQEEIANEIAVIERVRAVVEHASKMPGGRWMPAAGRTFE